ncbi:hypothetical protein RR49_01182 [Microbacterium ginsengisoli]|uniref:Uncharacterized protein n=1 Tax=Microbacterium ginsengisoli TaxID=400772 RepID=A0A0F0LXQ4_9MICO|nr:hypothetical protein [Microbacterium ginsengisoli]KJL37070.1 hypothetical protein RR49_01182 [Microbacterium ginsengisoli]
MSTLGYPRSQVVYLHLNPGRYARDLIVSKVAKSREAQVEPGTVIVKAKITVPAGFFDEAIPYVEIEFKPGDEIQPAEVTVSAEVEN